MERAYDKTLGAVNRWYTKLLAVFLGRRLDLFIALLVVFVVTIGVAIIQEFKFVDVQEEEQGGFEIDVELPPTTTLEEAEAYFRECEKKVEELSEEADLSGWFIVHRATWGEVQGWFNSPRTNDISPRELTEKIRDALPKKPGVNFYTGQESQVEEEKGRETFQVTLYGEDHEVLNEVAKSLEDVFVQVPGVLGLKSSGEPPPNELALVIDRERTQQQGINPQVVAGVVGYALRGQQLRRYRAEGREIPVRVRFLEEDRDTLSQLQSFYVPTASGGFVPLSSVTETQFLQGSKRNVDSRDSQECAVRNDRNAEGGHHNVAGAFVEIRLGPHWLAGLGRQAPPHGVR